MAQPSHYNNNHKKNVLEVIGEMGISRWLRHFQKNAKD